MTTPIANRLHSLRMRRGLDLITGQPLPNVTKSFTTTTSEDWVCPHCDKLVGERGDLFAEGEGRYRHNSCGKSFLVPPAQIPMAAQGRTDLGLELDRRMALARIDKGQHPLTGEELGFNEGIALQQDAEAFFERKNTGKCKRCKTSAANCTCEPWAFAPLFGDGKGNSGAANSVSTTGGQSPSPPSGANPGPGGINAPGIPNGPNAGTGPIVASVAESARTGDGSTKARGPLRRGGLPVIEEKKPMKNALNEALDFALRAAEAPEVIDAAGDPSMTASVPPALDAPPPVSVPVVAPDGVATVMSVMIAAVHRQFSHAGDLLFAHGYMDQDKRIALSSCVGDALKQLTLSIQSKCPWATSCEVGPDVARVAVVEERS